LGVDIIDVSSGGILEWSQEPLPEGYHVPASAKVKAVVQSSTAVMVVGNITKGISSEEYLSKGQADLIAVVSMSCSQIFSISN
jgi:2,4-dienoyl-CoA reductase-like NADH-dependent reductase (Old Yellow Enzyme family)